MYFSVTGDTVCYSDIFGQQIDGTHIGHTAHIKCKGSGFETKEISSFTIIADLTEGYSNDTLKKYHLQNNGIAASIHNNKDFKISVKPTNISIVDTAAFGPKFIYQTTVSVNMSYKNKTLYSKTHNMMFKGNSANDFPERDIVRISAYNKRNKKKYFIELSVKESQIFSKPNDAPEYKWRTIFFII
jgi:hypothetical protein